MVGDANPRAHDRDDPVLVESLPDPGRRNRTPPPTFGRTPGSPERLAGVAHGASADPEALLRQLHQEVRAAARMIRQLSMAERSKQGISTERGPMTVAQVIESFIVDHAEEHLAQVQSALRG